MKPTLEEARIQKNALDAAILAAIRLFEGQTKLSVRDVDLFHVGRYGSVQETVESVSTVVEL